MNNGTTEQHQDDIIQGGRAPFVLHYCWKYVGCHNASCGSTPRCAEDSLPTSGLREWGEAEVYWNCECLSEDVAR